MQTFLVATFSSICPPFPRKSLKQHDEVYIVSIEAILEGWKYWKPFVAVPPQQPHSHYWPTASIFGHFGLNLRPTWPFCEPQQSSSQLLWCPDKTLGDTFAKGRNSISLTKSLSLMETTINTDRNEDKTVHCSSVALFHILCVTITS